MREVSSPINTMLVSAAWKKATCVRISQPLAASCGKSRIESGVPAPPPA